MLGTVWLVPLESMRLLPEVVPVPAVMLASPQLPLGPRLFLLVASVPRANTASQGAVLVLLAQQDVTQIRSVLMHLENAVSVRSVGPAPMRVRHLHQLV